MRKLKQASQREKARKALKQGRDGPAETARPRPSATNGSKPKQNGKSPPSGEQEHGGTASGARHAKSPHH
jgi:hypothetical protein